MRPWQRQKREPVREDVVQEILDGLKPQDTDIAERHAAIIQLYSKGWSDLRISKHTGFSRHMVYRVREQYGLVSNFSRGRPTAGV